MTAQSILLLAAAATLLLVSARDVAARTIPNGASVLLATIGAVLRWQDGSLILAATLALSVVFGAALCWRFGVLGGGDVKLLGAAVFLIPPGTAPDLLLLVALWGGALAALYLVLRRLVPRLSRMRPHARRPLARGVLRRALRAESWRIRRRGSLPYGSAIAAGTLTALFAGGLP